MANNNFNNKKDKYPKTHEECGCTREDFISSLKYLSREALKELKDQGFVEAVCDECGAEYKVEGKELDNVIKNIIDESLEINENCSTCFLDCNLRKEE